MSGGQSRSSRPSRVLIIDDDPVMKALVQSCLSAPLYEILQSGSISEGLRAIEDWHPDVVLLDHQLPDGEGFHAIAEINGIDRQLPILYVTAASSATTAIEASRRGV